GVGLAEVLRLQRHRRLRVRATADSEALHHVARRLARLDNGVGGGINALLRGLLAHLHPPADADVVPAEVVSEKTERLVVRPGICQAVALPDNARRGPDNNRRRWSSCDRLLVPRLGPFLTQEVGV